jgi:hypothetical protein
LPERGCHHPDGTPGPISPRQWKNLRIDIGASQLMVIPPNPPSLYAPVKHVQGWANHKFKELRGCWPNHCGWAPEMEPTQKLLSWIRSRQIAFAKGRRRYG